MRCGPRQNGPVSPEEPNSCVRRQLDWLCGAQPCCSNVAILFVYQHIIDKKLDPVPEERPTIKLHFYAMTLEGAPKRAREVSSLTPSADSG